MTEREARFSKTIPLGSGRRVLGLYSPRNSHAIWRTIAEAPLEALIDHSLRGTLGRGD